MYNVTYGFGNKHWILDQFSNNNKRIEYSSSNGYAKIDTSCFAEYIDDRTEHDDFYKRSLYYKISAPKDYFQRIVKWINSKSVGVKVRIISKKDGMGIVSSQYYIDDLDGNIYTYLNRKEVGQIVKISKRGEKYKGYFLTLKDNIRRKKYLSVSEFVLEIEIDSDHECDTKDFYNVKCILEYQILVFLRQFSVYESSSNVAVNTFINRRSCSDVDLISATSKYKDNHSLVDGGFLSTGNSEPTVNEIKNIFSVPVFVEIFKGYDKGKRGRIKQTKIMIEIHNHVTKNDDVISEVVHPKKKINRISAEIQQREEN